MKIVIIGASGFVGRALSRALLEQGHAVAGLGTSPRFPDKLMDGFEWIRADTTRAGAWQTTLADADVVVNLAGRTIFKRWTRDYKKQIITSRVQTTRNVADALTGAGQTLLSTSAVGYYGSRGDEVLTSKRRQETISWPVCPWTGSRRPWRPNRKAPGWPSCGSALYWEPAAGLWRRGCGPSACLPAARGAMVASGSPGFT